MMTTTIIALLGIVLTCVICLAAINRMTALYEKRERELLALLEKAQLSLIGKLCDDITKPHPSEVVSDIQAVLNDQKQTQQDQSAVRAAND